MAELPFLMFSLPLSIMYHHHQACMMCSNSIFVHHAGLSRKTTHHRHHVQIVSDCLLRYLSIAVSLRFILFHYVLDRFPMLELYLYYTVYLPGQENFRANYHNPSSCTYMFPSVIIRIGASLLTYPTSLPKYGKKYDTPCPP